MRRRWIALWCWSYLAWLVLTWTQTAEQLLTGAVLAAAVATACAPLGAVAPPWALFRPSRMAAVGRLALWSVVSIVRANLSLSRRIWLPSRPLRPGMIIVPTEVRGEGAVAAVGLITSLIVDNQLVDLDLRRHDLQYHAVWVEDCDAGRNRDRINGPIEDCIQAMGGP